VTRDQIIAISRAALKRTQEPGFAQTPPNPKHLARLTELKAKKMGDVLYTDFQNKNGQYTKNGSGVDDLRFLPVEDTAPSEMPPVWPSYQAPEQDPA
jgi:hypothetical protein